MPRAYRDMAKKSSGLKGRNFALTIILGVFIAVMLSILFNLIVSYAYPSPEYNDYCKIEGQLYPKGYSADGTQECTFSKELQTQTDACTLSGGMPVYEYNAVGCTTGLKKCDMCNKEFESAMKDYNFKTFFVFALVGFVLIVVGLFVSPLIVQIASMPAGAVLVIEAAVKNFDNKLLVIITFALLIALAITLAIKKLK